MATRIEPEPIPGSISAIVPVFNEKENIRPLCDVLLPALEAIGRPFEIIFIDDGSRDGSLDVLAAVAAGDRRIKVITLRRNFGQTAAIMAGIDHARGEIIVPLDGDLQNDPADIAALIAKLEEGYDVVSGWRHDRQDNYLARNLPSRIANALISAASGVHLHDYGCTLKAYRRHVLQGFRLYGEMHRFVPIFAHWQGARITELAVRHHPRRFGQSKYGVNRVIKVLLDLMLVKFLTRYETKPIYVFGSVAIFMYLAGFLAGLYAVYLRFFESISFIQTPLPLFVSLCIITGTMCILMGFLSEIMVRIYFESQDKANYSVKKTMNFDPPS